MRKLHHRRRLEFSAIVAALTLFAWVPAAFAGEESGGGSTPGEPVVESTPSPSSPPSTAPPSAGWTSQGSGAGAGGEAAPIQRGSSVGSGGAPAKARSTSEVPSYTPESSGTYEPEPSAPSTFHEPASTPPAPSEAHSTEPPAPAPNTSRVAHLAVGAATPLAFSKTPQNGDAGLGAELANATFTDRGSQGDSGSLVLPLLIVAVLGFAFAYLAVYLRRQRRRQRQAALWAERDATWEAVVRQIEMERLFGSSESSAGPSRPSARTAKSSAERLQKLDVG